MEITTLQNKNGKPKYKQIILAIEEAIMNGDLKIGDKLPSLNRVKNRHSLSRDTVLMAYNELKTRGIVNSIVGKGYFLKSESITVEQRIFLLFDEFNAFKEDLYNSFLDGLGDNVQVDIYFHHFNETMFRKLVNDAIGNYNHYVIMPANIKSAHTIIDRLPWEKVYILDQTNPKLKQFSAIFQNFENDMFVGLSTLSNRIANYKKLVFLFPENKQPIGLLRGFKKFCKGHDIICEVIATADDRIPKKGEVYILLDDRNLILMIKKIKDEQLVLVKDIGIICYNETLLKEIVEGGITTISTDFKIMGKKLAKMILNNEHNKIENPNNVIVRSSI